MTARSVVLMATGAIMLGVAYYWLTLEAVGASVYLLAPGVWLKQSLGLRHGIPLWVVFLNTLAVAVAAAPVALAAYVAFDRRAIPVALSAAIGVAAFSLFEMLSVMHSIPKMPPLPWHEVALYSFDYIKLALLPALYLGMARRSISRLRRGGPWWVVGAARARRAL